MEFERANEVSTQDKVRSMINQVDFKKLDADLKAIAKPMRELEEVLLTEAYIKLEPEITLQEFIKANAVNK